MLLTGTSPCVPLAGMRFQSPTAALAHRWAQRRPGTALLRRPPTASGAAASAAAGASSSAPNHQHHPAACSAELCPLDGPGDSAPSAAFAASSSSSSARRRKRRAAPGPSSFPAVVAAAAQPPIAGAVAAKQAKLAAAAAAGNGPKPWYKEHADVWAELSSEAEFYAFLDGAAAAGDGRLVLVDFYATWCKACQSSFPQVSVIAGDPALRERVRFAKVCVDVLKPLVRSAGVRGLPAVQLYAPGSHRALATIDVPPSRVKHLRGSLEAALSHDWRTHEYRVDPNGFGPVALTAEQVNTREADALASLDGGAAPPSADEARREAARALEGSTASLYDRLLSTASGGSGISSRSGGSSSSGSESDNSNNNKNSNSSNNNNNNSNNNNGNSSNNNNSTSTSSTSSTSSASVYEEGAAQARAAWLASDPSARAAYGYGGRLDNGLYAAEVGVRMQPGEHYLDYTGASVYCQSQLRAAFDELASALFGNPHSANPSSSRTSAAVDDARGRVLAFFNADPREYSVVFTRSATGALKTVGETFPWAPGSEFAYLRESHNSVLGMREYALRAGGRFVALNETAVEAWLSDPRPVPPDALGAPHGAEGAWWTRASSPPPPLAEGDEEDDEEDADALASALDNGADEPLLLLPEDGGDGGGGIDAAARAAARAAAARAATNAARATAAAAEASAHGRPTFNLFAFPLEENFAGVKYPHRWVEAVRAKSTPSRPWRVLVDAAAFAPTQPLDLSALRPDFVSLSFYKLFGYPTGLGALIVRNDVAAELEPVFWGGGTVALATSADDFHVLKCSPVERLEEGTLNFLDVASLKHGFGAMERVGGMVAVRAHVAALTSWLYGRLSSLRHSNGAPLVIVFGKHEQCFGKKGGGGGKDGGDGGDASAAAAAAAAGVQGGVFNFEVLRPDGRVFSYKTVEREAGQAGLHLRSGQACAPGAALHYLGVQEREVEALAGKKEGCEDDVEYLSVKRRPGAAALMGPDLADWAEGAGGGLGEGEPQGPFSGSVDSGSDSDGLAAERERQQQQQEQQQRQREREGPSPLSAGPSPVAGRAADVASEWVQVPLGSVRASLGYMSTFDDVYALARFLELKYKDRAE